MESEDVDVLELTAEIVSAYVGSNKIPSGEIAVLINDTYSSLTALGNQTAVEKIVSPQVPAISIKRSITSDYLICLEDGLRFKSLKRHINSKFGLTPEQYRTKWKLPADYPMVAPAYAELRSELAKSMGLGRKSGFKVKPKARKKA